MRAVVITRSGPPEVLELQQRPDPVAQRGELLVEVEACALNRADLLQRRGLYPPPEGVDPDVAGLEVAGRVVVSETDKGRYSPGDRVMALLSGGGYAERVAVAESLAMPIPKGLSAVEAAAIPEAFLTAFDALFLQAGLSQGEIVLVHACGSGVGSAAVQLATDAGALVAGTAGSEEKLDRARQLGLRYPVNYREQDLEEALERQLGKRRCDVVLDLVGSAHWPANLAVLAPRGRIMVVGLVSGGRIELDLRQLMAKRASMTGTVLRPRSQREKADLISQFEQRALPRFTGGALQPVLDRTFPLEQAAEAHRYMEENRNFGKIVLKV